MIWYNTIDETTRLVCMSHDDNGHQQQQRKQLYMVEVVEVANIHTHIYI